MKPILTIMLAFIVSAAFAQKKEIDTLAINIAKWNREQDAYNQKMADTNYWSKDISNPNSGVYSTVLLPARDTVACYFECPLIGNKGEYWIKTLWYLGWATRYHEHIEAFYYQMLKGRVFNRVTNTILIYKIK